MGINLQKGQKIDLTKNGGAGLRSVMVGLGWDEAPRRGGLFSQPQPIDCDASAILCGPNGKLVNTGNINDAVVYFGNLRHPSGAIQHMYAGQQHFSISPCVTCTFPLTTTPRFRDSMSISP